MIGTNFPNGYLPANGGADSFTNVKTELQDADITFGNLEGPLCDGTAPSQKCANSSPGKCYAFRSPASYAPHYKDAGFDLLSTANNHANDFGSTCRYTNWERILSVVAWLSCALHLYGLCQCWCVSCTLASVFHFQQHTNSYKSLPTTTHPCVGLSMSMYLPLLAKYSFIFVTSVYSQQRTHARRGVLVSCLSVVHVAMLELKAV